MPDDLPQAVRVASHDDRRPPARDVERHVLRRRRARHLRHRFGDNRRSATRDARPGAAGRSAPSTRRADPPVSCACRRTFRSIDSKPRALRRRVQLPRPDQVQPAEHGVERRAQLVRDRPEEFVLHPARGFASRACAACAMPASRSAVLPRAPQLRDERGQQQAVPDEQREVRFDRTRRCAARPRPSRAPPRAPSPTSALPVPANQALPSTTMLRSRNRPPSSMTVPAAAMRQEHDDDGDERDEVARRAAATAGNGYGPVPRPSSDSLRP